MKYILISVWLIHYIIIFISYVANGTIPNNYTILISLTLLILARDFLEKDK